MKNKIETLRKEIGRLDWSSSAIQSRKNKLTEKIAKEYFKGMTMDYLEKLWNKSKFEKRYEILEHCPYYLQHLDKLDSFGGLRKGELEEQIIKAKFGRCEWLETETIQELFGEFLRESKD